VAILLQIIDPSRVYFGKKDYQQMRLIERMVTDLHFQTEVVEVETVREPDGLAMSTRNRYLSPRDRQVAATIFEALRASRDAYRAGHTDPSTVLAAGRSIIERQAGQPRIEYYDAVNRRTLMPVTAVDEETLVATAVHVGGARLIDNVEVGEPDR
jgi:pantoate--beta-alanine ligase